VSSKLRFAALLAVFCVAVGAVIMKVSGGHTHTVADDLLNFTRVL
jgi:hypothetical protein